MDFSEQKVIPSFLIKNAGLQAERFFGFTDLAWV